MALLLSVKVMTIKPIIDHIANKGIPQVVLNRPVETSGVLNVLSDEEQGAFHAEPLFD